MNRRTESLAGWCATVLRLERRLLVLMLVATTGGWFAPSPFVVATAQAASPAIAPRQHPFDPDWPEVQLILRAKCTSCHRAGTKHSDFTSYEALLSARVVRDPDAPLDDDDASATVVDGAQVIVPGNVQDSQLWVQVVWNVHDHDDSEMPLEPAMPDERHDWLTAGQLATIHRWIENGAREYCSSGRHGGRPLMETDFPSAKECAGCHPQKYEQWSRSMHAYAQHSPAMGALNGALQERTGGTIGTFCTRCHTPVGTALGEDGLIANNQRSRISMEGITCVACHRRPNGQYKGSGRLSVKPGALLEACMFGPFENPVMTGADGHPSAQLPYIKSAQFCGECHDVFNPRGFRLEEAFSEWNNSPAAKAGITCQACHMGPVQGLPFADDERPLGRAAVVPGVPPEMLPLRHLTDHTFAGPDYSLLPNTEFPHKLDWMYETDYRDASKLTRYQKQTLTELRLKNRASLRIADAKRYELLSAAASMRVSHPRFARAGDKINVRVDVENRVSGHSFPTGFTAERQVWVSIDVIDPNGHIIFQSGDLDKNGDLRDNHSHEVLAGNIFYDKHLMNFQNKFVALSNKGTERSIIIPVNRDVAPINVLRPEPGISISFGRPPRTRIAKGSMPPLATMGRKYKVALPNCSGPYSVRVMLNFRHLPPTLLDTLGAGGLKPLIEVVVLDEYAGVINVAP